MPFKFALLLLLSALFANQAAAYRQDTDCPKIPVRNPNGGWHELTKAQRKARLRFEEEQKKFEDCLSKEYQARESRYNNAMIEIQNREMATHIADANAAAAPEAEKRVKEFTEKANQARLQGRKEYANYNEGTRADLQWLEGCQKESASHECYAKFFRGLREAKILESSSDPYCSYGFDRTCGSLFRAMREYLSLWGPQISCDIGGTEIQFTGRPSAFKVVQNIGREQFEFLYGGEKGIEVTVIRAPTREEEQKICEEGRKSGNPNTCYVGHVIPVDKVLAPFDVNGIAAMSLAGRSAYCIRDPLGPYFSYFE